jgi:hypothetical protein
LVFYDVIDDRFLSGFITQTVTRLCSFFAHILIKSIVLSRSLPQERGQSLILWLKAHDQTILRHSGMLLMVVATRSGT